MPLLNAENIRDEILGITKYPASTLFAGAGISVPCGLPTWHEYMLNLASSIEKADSALAEAMRERIADKLYLDAAALFEVSRLPDGTKLKVMAEPFLRGNAAPLKPLMTIPWTSVLTTNFDRMLLDAWASVHGKAPITAELREATMKTARYSPECFIARIHGRAEVPQTMALSSRAYKDLEADMDYGDLIHHILTQTRCLFVGFSFTDPAINHFLEFFKQRVGPNYPQEHLALLPEGASNFAAELRHFNIRTEFYDAGISHEILWHGIKLAAEARSKAPFEASGAAHAPLRSAHRLLASAYVHHRLEPDISPLRDQIFKGLMLGVLASAGQPLTLTEFVAALKADLPLTLDEVEAMVGNPLADLVRRGFVTADAGRFSCPPVRNDLDQAIAVLAAAAVDRAFVRHGEKLPAAATEAMTGALETLILQRGWDLGAHFAGAASGNGVTSASVSRAVSEHRGNLSRYLVGVLAEVLYDLLNAPDTAQAAILADLGRLSFATDVVLQQGRSALLHREALPERVYLDASFLLPAIAPGHPFHEVYRAALARWRDAAERSAIDPRIVIPEEYLDEIVSHRRLAIENVRSLGLENRDALQKHMMFYSAHNGNVFISGYAGSDDDGLGFGEWINRVAPYTSIPELKRYLAAMGIDAVNVQRELEARGLDYGQAYRSLSTALDADSRSGYRAPILIRHDAIVMTQVGHDIEHGERVLLVTADNRLRRAAGGGVLGAAAYATISGIGFVGFVDFFIGMDSSPSSVSRLMWGIRYYDDETDTLLHLRSYFTDLALRTYDEAMVMTLPDVVDSVARSAAGEAYQRGLKLTRDENMVETAKFLDKFEDQFYANLKEAMERRGRRDD